MHHALTMTEIKKYKIPGARVTVELDEGLTIEETCPSDNDLVVVIPNRLLLHLNRK